MSSPGVCRETGHPHIQKKFKQYRIKWDISNFFVECHQENWEICCPEFDGPQGSKFMLVLKPAPKQDCTFSCLVRRSASDSGPETVWANFKLEVSGAYVESKCIQRNKLCSFNKGSEFETTFTAMENFCKKLAFRFDRFIINSDMILYIEGEDAELEECTDAGLKGLSEDMLALFQSGVDYDIELKAGDSVVQAHKAILYARCPDMSWLLDDSDRKTMDLSIGIPDIDYESATKTMEVLYTGNVKYALEKPSLAFYEIAKVMDIPELQNYYYEEGFTFISTFHSQEFIFKWIIHDFNSILENNKYLESPVFTDYDSNRTWKLHFWPRSGGSEDCVAIILETNERPASTNIWLEIAIYDGENYRTIDILQEQFNDRQAIGFEKLAYRSLMKTYAINDILSIGIKLKLSTGRQHSEIQRHRITSVSKNCADEPYKTLSKDIKELLNSGLFSDGKITFGDYIVPVHKCILASRCKSLYDMLKLRLDQPLVMNDVNVNIMNILLTYLYSGSIPAVKSDFDSSEIYRAAKYVDLPRLEYFCSHVLDEHLKSMFEG